MQSFFPLDDLSSFVKNQVTIFVWGHFWVFYSIPIIFLPLSVPVLYSFYHYCSVILLDIRDDESAKSLNNKTNTHF